MEPAAADPAPPHPETVLAAQRALERLGYHRVVRNDRTGPTFWVAEAERPNLQFPVFLWDGPFDRPAPAISAWRDRSNIDGSPGRAILVVPNERAAEAALPRPRRRENVGAELRVLVVPPNPSPKAPARWHTLVLTPRELLDVATGVVVGLFKRAQAAEGSSEIDFQEMLQILKRNFRIDLQASLGVDSDEAALFLLYQLAQRYAFAPGDPSANLHTLVLRPTGPAARLPWFAA